MPKRPGKCYRKLEPRPYVKKRTRRGKELVRGVPDPKIRIFHMGNKKGEFPVILSLVTQEAGQIRHFALEAARVTANRYLDKKVGKENYHLKINVYPHHVLRENKMMAFAGADRLQDGMRKAFGKPIGTAARVKPGQKVIIVGIKKEYVERAKEALKRALMKIPMPCKILVEELPAPVKIN
ncbi:MAG: 50S ribosomal protein L16 [Candidatus Odinarchaeia archaeon]